MVKQQYYYIECTFDDNGKDWQRWSKENYLSFSRAKSDMWKLSQQEQEFNQQEDSTNSLVSKIKGFRVVHETIQTKRETISECLFD